MEKSRTKVSSFNSFTIFLVLLALTMCLHTRTASADVIQGGGTLASSNSEISILSKDGGGGVSIGGIGAVGSNGTSGQNGGAIGTGNGVSAARSNTATSPTGFGEYKGGVSTSIIGAVR